MASNLTRFLDTLADESKELEAYTSARGPLTRLYSYLTGVKNLTAIKYKIHKETVERCKPRIRNALATAYAQSHLGQYTPADKYEPTGETKRAAVTDVEIIANQHSIAITPAKNCDERVYKRMGAFQYGYLHGHSSQHNKNVRRIKRQHESHYGKTGQRKFGGKTYIAPKEFFNIDSLDINALYLMHYRGLVAEYLQGISQ